MEVDGKAIRSKMAMLGINTIAELADKSGINRNTLSNVINNESNPSANTMLALYETLELTPEEAGRIFFTKNITSHVS